MKHAAQTIVEKAFSDGAGKPDTPEVTSPPEPRQSPLRKCYLRRSRKSRYSESTFSAGTGGNDEPETPSLPEPEAPSSLRKFFAGLKYLFCSK